MKWFYESNGAQKGPVSENELDHLISQGVILPTTLVWRDGLPNWTPLSQVRNSAPVGTLEAAPGSTQCDSCRRYFSPAEIVPIAGRNICAGCKPVVLQALQQGTMPGEGNDPERTGPAWEQRETLGWLAAGWATTKAVLLEPSETFRTMRVSGGINSPFLFHLIFGAIGGSVLGVYMAIAQAMGFSYAAQSTGAQVSAAVGGGLVVGIITQVISAVMGAALSCFIQGAVVHVCLMICGGARRPFEATFRAICYGAGSVAVLHIIPGIGTIASIPWGLVVTCIALARTHEIDLWRAVVALLLPVIVCCLFAIVLAVMIGGMAGMQKFQ